MLERADCNRTVTAIAFDAGYQSLEAFTRAFRKAFRISPSLYRRMGVSHTPAAPTSVISAHPGPDWKEIP